MSINLEPKIKNILKTHLKEYSQKEKSNLPTYLGSFLSIQDQEYSQKKKSNLPNLIIVSDELVIKIKNANENFL